MPRSANSGESSHLSDAQGGEEEEEEDAGPRAKRFEGVRRLPVRASCVVSAFYIEMTRTKLGASFEGAEYSKVFYGPFVNRLLEVGYGY